MSIASEINRIQQNVTDSLTAVANKGVVVPSGSNSDDLPGLIAQITSGTGSAITITDEQDSHGGIIRTISAVSLAGDTVSPATLLQGYTAHNSLGEAIVGTATGGTSARLQAKTGVTPTATSQTIRPDSGYDGLSSVQINAMPSGTAGTPSATKGSVSNHSITITPSVTNTTGYITGGTKTGTAVTVSVSELESGTKSITENGTGISVSGYSAVNVNVPSGGDTLYTRTVIVPQQTVSGSRTPALTNTGVLVAGEYYIATVDGTEYICTAKTQWNTSPVIGDMSLYYNVQSEYDYPFAIGYEPGAGMDCALLNSSSHTIKVEHLEFVDGPLNLISKNITSNGTYNASSDGATGYSSVTVNVSGSSANLQAKTNITPTESSQTITPDSGYDGLSSVKINGISTTYVGSGITRRSSSDLTASGATVTVPAGYYSAQASKAVSTMTLPTAAASSATSGYTSKATIGRSTSNQYINIPAGYNSAGGYYTISATPNGTVTAPSTISGTSATVSTGTNTLTLTKTVSVTPSVSTAGYVSSGTAGNSSVSLTASVTTKAAATITPGTSNQTIASGTYLTGTQTIAGDANLVSGNILSGKTIFGVAGSVTFQTIYSGSSNPSSSTGVNGDIYIQTA